MTFVRRVALSAIVLASAYAASVNAQNGIVHAGNQSYTAPASAAAPAREGGYIGMQLNVRSNDFALVVERVSPASKAEFAGLQSGDVVLAVEGQPVHSMCDIYSAMRGKGPGDIILVRIERAGEQHDLSVVVSSAAEMKAEQAQASTLPQSTTTYSSPCERLEKEFYNNPILGVYVNSTGTATLSGVIPNTGATKAELTAGDIIESIDGTLIPSFVELKKTISTHRPGDRVLVQYRRDGQLRSVEATLNSYADVNQEVVTKLKAECAKAANASFVAGERLNSIEVSPATLNLAPNPSTGAVNISVAGLEATEFRMMITDLIGNKFLDRTVMNSQNSFSTTVDLSLAPRGVYTVTISQGAKTFKEKLIIE